MRAVQSDPRVALAQEPGQVALQLGPAQSGLDAIVLLAFAKEELDLVVLPS